MMRIAFGIFCRQNRSLGFANATLYTPGSVHTGKIAELMDKGAVITLNEGGEGFATPKHLVKEDGTQATLGEELPFKVIEFNKDSKRIILSHSRTFEDAQRDAEGYLRGQCQGRGCLSRGI